MTEDVLVQHPPGETRPSTCPTPHGSRSPACSASSCARCGTPGPACWLLIAIGVITAAIIVIFFLVSDPSDRVFQNFIGITATPQGFLLPVLGILLITSEWGQRTALTTFTLVPSRVRGSSRRRWRPRWCSACVAVVIAIALAALATLAGGQDDGSLGAESPTTSRSSGCSRSTDRVFRLRVRPAPAQLRRPRSSPTSCCRSASRSSPASGRSALSDVAPWIDLGTAQTPLFDGTTQNLTGEQWAQIATASAASGSCCRSWPASSGSCAPR